LRILRATGSGRWASASLSEHRFGAEEIAIALHLFDEVLDVVLSVRGAGAAGADDGLDAIELGAGGGELAVLLLDEGSEVV
jgi:hypothetical protein